MPFRIRYMRLQPGFLYIFSVPNVRINIRKYHDIPAKRRMRRESTLREGKNDASH